METPEVGFVELTVRMYVVTGGGLLLDRLLPPPQPAKADAKATAVQSRACRKLFITGVSRSDNSSLELAGTREANRL